MLPVLTLGTRWLGYSDSWNSITVCGYWKKKQRRALLNRNSGSKNANWSDFSSGFIKSTFPWWPRSHWDRGSFCWDSVTVCTLVLGKLPISEFWKHHTLCTSFWSHWVVNIICTILEKNSEGYFWCLLSSTNQTGIKKRTLTPTYSHNFKFIYRHLKAKLYLVM